MEIGNTYTCSFSSFSFAWVSLKKKNKPMFVLLNFENYLEMIYLFMESKKYFFN